MNHDLIEGRAHVLRDGNSHVGGLSNLEGGLHEAGSVAMPVDLLVKASHMQFREAPVDCLSWRFSLDCWCLEWLLWPPGCCWHGQSPYGRCVIHHAKL